MNEETTNSEDDGLLGDLMGARPDQTDAVARSLQAAVRRALVGTPGEPFRLGRFTVLELIGRGGMGAVFVAYDPDLDRKIALKVLHNRGERGRREVLREGRALARLKHPGVVGVYEVGVVAEQVFVAMEYVAGANLRAWLRGRPTSAQVLTALIDAGRGLAAAHDAELIHFDVKPENLLIDAAGRGRVIDFGLARSLEDAGQVTGTSGSTAPGGSTTRGGTPGYIAPERALGERGDPRSDQYSFCVTCWEALCGRRPGAGEPTPLGGGRVPARVLRALRRGMSPAPKDRFPSMHALLAELDARPARRWWLAAAALLAVLLALGGYGLGQRGQLAGPRCSPPTAEIAEIWGDGRAEALGAAFLATGVPFARDTWALARPAIDRYAEAWSAAHVRACEQTHVVGVASQEVFNRRRLCLADRRLHLAAVLDRFAVADVDAVTHADEILDRMPAVEDCEQAELVELRPPSDPVEVQAFVGVRRELARARVEVEAGRPETVRPQVERLIVEARAVGNTPLLIDALVLAAAIDDLGARRELAGGRAREAVTLALAHAEPAQATRATLTLIRQARELQPHGPVQEDLLVFAEGLCQRAGEPPRLRGAVMLARGVELLKAGRHGEALEVFEAGRAYALAHALPRVAARALVHVGHARAMLGDYEGALVADRAALEEHVALVGPMHPLQLQFENNYASDLLVFERYEESFEHFERVVAIARANFDEDHPMLGIAYNNLATLDAFGRERYEEALVNYARAQALFERNYGPNDVRVAQTVCVVAIPLLELGRFDEALAAAERGAAMMAETLPPGNCQRMSCTGLRGEALVDLGRHAEALALIEPALVLAGQGECIKDGRGDLELTIARALWGLRGEPARARITALLAEMSPSSSPRAVRRADALRAAMGPGR